MDHRIHHITFDNASLNPQLINETTTLIYNSTTTNHHNYFTVHRETKITNRYKLLHVHDELQSLDSKPKMVKKLFLVSTKALNISNNYITTT